ncbi:MAG: TlpA family protein disulfide reductase, partial [Tagaea sp.]|nr:TlpA family protein disulfide reductase [Tagaea sp.]
MMPTRRALIAALGASCLVPASRAQTPEFRGQIGPFVRHRPPVAAPAISFRTAEGKELGLGDFAGRVAVVNFWATWCAPCVEEMPALDRLHAALAQEGIEVVAISVDRGGLRQAAPFFEVNGLKNLPVYLDPSGASMRALGVRGLPTTIVIDRQGREAGRLEGAAHWDSEPAKRLLRAI